MTIKEKLILGQFLDRFQPPPQKELPFSIMHSWPGEVRGGVITVNPDTDCLVTGGQGDQTDSDRLSLIDRLPTEETVSTLTHVSVKQTQFLLPES